MNNDDLWMKHPVNYTPYFKWYIKKQEEMKRRIVEKIDTALLNIEREDFRRDMLMDLYLVWWDQDTKTFKVKPRHKIFKD